jgi:extradiol dioxygenase family protein
VYDLDAARRFYAGLLGCRVGRSDTRWTDFDLYGHQITAHLVDAGASAGHVNQVDGERVPVPHFGIILDMDSWRDLAARLESLQADFIIAPTIRFRGQAGEQATLFLRDPSGNALEFKAFADPARIFAT